ncbi:4-aminobutyrate aminotransferase/(S)-3-amino-2-methylpropionate transaminase [Salsuginibacillus halophilus]|uniref:(S)-3-amino-2-methylpropionate transaminase n=1 Tax=Salsuginibacillus halophilus TaxID=517424 RepID=A0A2P8H9N6_9BACI|nr:4-aminobutyrate--2-oxoglutarate transaminase [Salsuginibacillus halophilus]PSL42946.1 4-aminobutyrate aminotransferase/(S)-3-amino-2-methylpropionate transaminase [Salsuginibacillus halophilus]
MMPKRTTAEWQEIRDQYIPQGVGNGNRNIAKYGRGAELYDIEGERYIDFAGAIGTINVGHAHPEVVKAIQEQAENVIHPGFNVMMYDSYIELAKQLTEITPGEHAKQTILLNSGAEAVENAVKIARKYTKRQAVVTFDRAFHGRTNMTMGMTSKVKPYKFEFGPFAGELYKAPYPYPYRKPDDMSDETYEAFMIEEFERFFLTTVAPESTACVVMEPVQGEGGFIVPPKRFVKYVEEFCKKHGILFVADEIQTGFGRTGAFLASEHFEITPDFVTLSKSLAGGVPLSAVVGRSEVMNEASPGELGGTYAGSPLGCAAALAAIDVIRNENLNERAEVIGEQIEAKGKAWAEKYEWVGEVRRLGAMVAIEIVEDRKTKTPDKMKAAAIAKAANASGVLLLTAGLYGNVVRFLPPLVMTDEQLEEGLEKIASVFDDL